jgi:tRNA (guanosine-2'-O-)-methyltransferase
MMQNSEKKQTIEELLEQMTPRRIEFLKNVLTQRTNHFAMVLEDLFDPHNISAVIRSSECYGLQDVHVIEEIHPYRVNNSVLKGSFKWLSLSRYKERKRCFETLKSQGYQIAVASTNTDKSIRDIDLSVPTAFYLGTEFKGNHPDTLAQADVHFKLPQYGVTESFNVSVAGGVLMTYLDVWMQDHGGRDAFAFKDEKKDQLFYDWCERSVFGVEKNSPMKDIR